MNFNDADAMPSRSQFERPSVQAMAGSICLALATVLVMLAILSRTQPLSFMPRSWHANRTLWYLMIFVLYLAGVGLLWRQRETGDPETVRRSSPAFQRVVLYTRRDCPLCDEAKQLLAEYQRRLPTIEEVDIDTDPAWKEKYDTCVPVVEIDGKLRFRGRVSRVLLERLLDAAASRS